MIDIQQIIYALERQARDLDSFADRLAQDHDYSAEFPAADADRMRDAIGILSASLTQLPAEPAAVEAKDVLAAIYAVDREAARRGEMFPQTSDEQRDDRRAVTRVMEMIRWYDKNTGCKKIKAWPAGAAPSLQVPAAEPVSAKISEALNWYADEARACARDSGSAKHNAPEALLASVTVLALDGGRRADEALAAQPSQGVGEPVARKDGSVSFEEAQDLARKHAKAEPESYYSEPFEPHLWVINAIVEASATWYQRAVDERVRRVKAERAAPTPPLAPPRMPLLGEPVALVPVHPRNGPLWANTVPVHAASNVPKSYPLMSLYTAPTPPLAAVPEWKAAVMQAYAHLWKANNEPGTPNQYDPMRASYEARKRLRELLTHQERGEAINALLAASPQPKAEGAAP